MHADIMKLGVVTMIVTAAISAFGADNLLANASFELPEEAEYNPLPSGWLEYHTHAPCATVTPNVSRTGKQSLRLTSPGEKDGHGAVFQRIPVEEGDKYIFQAFAKDSPTSPPKGSFFAVLSIEWLDATGKEVLRDTSKPWTKRLSRLRWDDIRLSAKAPKHAVEANFVIQIYDDKGTGNGECFVDDALVVNESPSSEGR